METQVLDRAIATASVSFALEPDLIRQLRALDHQTARDKRILARAKNSLPTVNLQKLIEAGGFDENYCPRIGVAAADSERVTVNVDFSISHAFMFLPGHGSIEVPIRLPFWMSFRPARRYEAEVPFVPPEVRPRDGLRGLLVAWEPAWNRVPGPVDPVLLKHFDGDIYGIVATWNLTQRELDAMRIARN